MGPSFRLDALDKENILPPAGKESQFRRRLAHSLLTIQWDIPTLFVFQMILRSKRDYFPLQYLLVTMQMLNER
jgi:hypothetical protein